MSFKNHSNRAALMLRLSHRYASLIRFSFSLACAALLAIAIPNVTAQDPGSDSDLADANAAAVADQVTSAKLKEFQTQLENATDIDDETRAKVAGIVTQAADELNRATKLEASGNQDRSLVQNVQSRFETLQNEIQATEAKPLEQPPESATLTELESGLAQQLATMQDAKNRVTTLQADQARRAERRKQVALLQSSHAQRVTEAEQQLAANSPGGESSWLTNARKLLQLSKLQSLALEPPAYQWELARYDAEQAVNLQSLRIQQAQADVTRAEATVAQLNQRIDALRKQQARSRVDQLRLDAEQIAAPAQKQLALRNVELGEENETVVRNIGAAASKTDKSQDDLDKLRALDKRTRERIERVGRSGAIGLELRKQRSILPDLRDIKRQGSTRQELMQEVEMRRLNLEDDLADAVRQPPDDSASGLEKKIHVDYVETLQSITKNYEKYFQQLSDLDFTQSQLIKDTETYRSFLDENVLWIRSNSFFGLTALYEAAEKVRELVRPDSWADVGRSLWIDAFSRPWLYGLGLLAFLLLMPARYRGRSHLVQLGKMAERPTCTEFSVTLRAFLMTFTMAIAWPLVLIFVGWRLVASPLDSPFPMAVGQGLIAAGVVLILLNVVRHSCREFGLGGAHFGWPTRVTELLRRKMRQLRFLLLPFVFIVVMLRELDGIENNNGLERLCLTASLIVIGWALSGILHPRHGALAEFFQKNPNTWFSRTKSFWCWFLIGFPIFMAILIISGFYYTATELTWRFWHTIWIAVILVALRAFAIRALQVNHRKIRIQKLKERRATQVQSLAQGSAQGSTQGSTQGSAPSQPPPVEASVSSEALTLENEHEALRTNSEQVIRILHSGLLLTGLLFLWFLWSGLVPALSILNEVNLWDTEREVAVDTVSPTGEISRTTESRVEKITLINLFAAILIGLVTFTLVRNVPGLIELTILQRLPLEASFKFAIVTMCRYAILVVGLLLGFSSIGATWSKLQWLVAALTVGLGFGLQEIFGNFVSGIIILWERPVRIGDVVTLDGVSGTVSRIQMRATTISDWDRKEYIVPNKDFVTGRVLNWTRSDQVSRIVIPVGIAYGSDVRRAISLLIKVATDHPTILNDPGPVATFDGFGDSTLNLTLRCFIPSLERRLETVSELNLAIDDQFNEAGIEIAFPQQDLHIRSIPPQWQTEISKNLSAPPEQSNE